MDRTFAFLRACVKLFGRNNCIHIVFSIPVNAACLDNNAANISFILPSFKKKSSSFCCLKVNLFLLFHVLPVVHWFTFSKLCSLSEKLKGLQLLVLMDGRFS